jgi:hypothetical protein
MRRTNSNDTDAAELHKKSTSTPKQASAEIELCDSEQMGKIQGTKNLIVLHDKIT